MKRLALLSYFFPPDGGPGVQRASKFCKYLPQFGWQPLVITRNPQKEAKSKLPSDETLDQEIEKTTRIVRVESSERIPPWITSLPDIDIARQWIGPAWNAVDHAIRSDHPHVLMITMSPFDLAYIGIRAAREHSIPVVMDLRDPWALDGWRVRPSFWAWRQDFRVMKRALGSAAAVIANSPDARKTLLAGIDNLATERVVVIPNGYDADDFENFEKYKQRQTNQFTLVHTGTLHSDWIYKYRGWRGHLRRFKHWRAERIDPSGRTLLHLLYAIQILAARRHPLVDILRISLVGNAGDATRRCVIEFGLENLVRFEGYRSHSESIARTMHADALFLPLHDLPPGERSRIIPGKTYEYLAAGRPILGCLPEGDARDLVERSGFGYLAEPTQPESIAAALDRLYRDWKSDKLAQQRPALWVRDYERRALTSQLSDLLEAVTVSHPSQYQNNRYRFR